MEVSGSALVAYQLAHPEREPIVSRMLALLRSPANVFSRAQFVPGHFTASAFVVCPERRRLLLVHHAKLGRWLQPGGHIEPGDVSLSAAARREVTEETGAQELQPLELPCLAGAWAGQGVSRLGSDEPPIFDVDIHWIPASSKEAAHAHFDVRYAFRAGSLELCASGEVRSARWVELGAVAQLNPEESIMRCVDRLRAP
jgi:8-oxo-dGTP pyrophosphatase MutT (NUDIX family)